MSKHFETPKATEVTDFIAGHFDGNMDAGDQWPQVLTGDALVAAANARLDAMIAQDERNYQEAMADKSDGYMDDDSSADDFFNWLTRESGKRFDYDNLAEYRTWYVAEYVRGYSEKAARLATTRADEQRFAVDARPVERITME